MHLEAGLPNPLEKNWYVSSILKGIRRVKGDASVQKLPRLTLKNSMFEVTRPTLLYVDSYVGILFFFTTPCGE